MTTLCQLTVKYFAICQLTVNLFLCQLMSRLYQLMSRFVGIHSFSIYSISFNIGLKIRQCTMYFLNVAFFIMYIIYVWKYDDRSWQIFRIDCVTKFIYHKCEAREKHQKYITRNAQLHTILCNACVEGAFVCNLNSWVHRQHINMNANACQ